MMIYIIAYLLVVFLFLFIVFLMLKFVEYIYCSHFKVQPPMVPANQKSKKLIAEYINEHYKDAKTVFELGSGFGGVARYIARHTNKKVTAIENMYFSYYVSRFLDLFCRAPSKTILYDMFEYLDNNKCDIAIAYLDPELTERLLKYKHKIHVLISVDFEMQTHKPTHIIDLGKGFTRLNGKLYPHKLFIYEF